MDVLPTLIWQMRGHLSQNLSQIHLLNSLQPLILQGFPHYSVYHILYHMVAKTLYSSLSLLSLYFFLEYVYKYHAS